MLLLDPRVREDDKFGVNKIMNKIWKFFASLKLTIILFIILTISSIIGTLLLQKPLETISPYIRYKASLPYSVIKSFDFLGFFDLYHSKWFLILLLLLCVNLVVCSIERFKITLKRLAPGNKILDDNLKKELKNVVEIETKKNTQQILKTIHNHFHKKRILFIVLTIILGVPILYGCINLGAHVFWWIFTIVIALAYIAFNFYHILRKPQIFEDNNIYYEQGKLGRFGVYVTHLSIILILIGGMIGATFGIEGSLFIKEGEAKGSISARGKGLLPLPFQVECVDFDVSFYDKTERPKEYTSLLKIIKDGEIKKQKKIEVNDPLKFMGYYFYQSSYEKSGIERISLKLINKIKKESQEIKLSDFHKEINFTNQKLSLKIIDYKENFEGFGPSLKLSVKKGKKEESFWVFKKYPNFDCDNRTDNFCFQFIDLKQAYFTGLQVSKDPGVPIVWAGCIILILGLIITFFYPHRKIWAQVLDGKVIIAGASSKDRIGFKENFNTLVGKIKS